MLTVHCFYYSIKSIIPVFAFHSFWNNFWELLNTTVTLQPGWRISRVEMLIHIWLWTRDFGRGLGVQWHLPLTWWFYIRDISAVKCWGRWAGRNLPWLYVVKVIWWCAIRCTCSFKWCDSYQWTGTPQSVELFYNIKFSNHCPSRLSQWMKACERPSG